MLRGKGDSFSCGNVWCRLERFPSFVFFYISPFSIVSFFRERHLCCLRKSSKLRKFLRWMPRLGLRWRTQRIAISNANCRIPWIIRFLNVLYAPGYSWEHVWSQRLLNLSCPPEFRTSSLERANLCTSELLSKLATDALNVCVRLTNNCSLFNIYDLFRVFIVALSGCKANFAYVTLIHLGVTFFIFVVYL